MKIGDRVKVIVPTEPIYIEIAHRKTGKKAKVAVLCNPPKEMIGAIGTITEKGYSVKGIPNSFVRFEHSVDCDDGEYHDCYIFMDNALELV